MKYSAKKVWKYLTHNFYKAMAIASVLAFSSEALAVTDNEMDQAEAIAAKFYIRYVNNASGYLDTFTPSSMSDLESRLANDKDKESFKEFKNSSVASDFASWDKERLVEYWSITFFQNNASRLDSKGANNGEARVRIRKGISALQVTPPVPPAPEPAIEPTGETIPEEAQPISGNSQYDPLQEHYVETQDELLGKMEALQDSLAADQDVAAVEKKSSGTWVYIMILSILVVVVIVLVAYASRTMKSSKKSDDGTLPIDSKRDRGGFQPASASATDSAAYSHSVADEARLREKYSKSLAEKSEEIMQLSRQLADMEMKAAQLKEENRLLKLELEGYRNASAERPVSRQPVQAAHESSGHGALHEVYLGRVNSRGIFVRADRQPVDGQSIYKLSTTNGVSGTFTVVSNSYIDKQLLSDPEKWLSGGCMADDLYDTHGRYSVITEIPGQAEFRDGAWRVGRKAMIRYV